MSSPAGSSRPSLARPIRNAALLCGCLSCARVLGVPEDPVLVEDSASEPELVMASGERSPSAEATREAPRERAPGAGDRSAPDGVITPGQVSAIDPAAEAERAEDVTPPGAVPPPDADGADAGAGVSPAPACEGPERVPVDVVFLVDNSGSMPEEAEAFEQALPSFVEQLDDGAVDHRVILISRHRAAERSASDEASTSVCVAAPLSALTACPSQRPAPGPRFFHYSIKLDADDSLTRALEAFSEPDPFGLATSGWSEWLRPGARTVFIELTDADAALGASAFVGALQALAPARFGTDPARPEFVFHAVTGLLEKPVAADIYFADEPLEPRVCSGTGSNPDNAGLVYQELSRLTGGVRLSICPAAPLTLRFAALAADVVLRSVRQCPD